MGSIHDRGRFGWPAYRLKAEDRQAIVEQIRTEPGVRLTTLRVSMGLPAEALRWQLDILLAQRDILEVRCGNGYCYFVNDGQWRDVAEAAGFMQGSRAAGQLLAEVSHRPDELRAQIMRSAAEGVTANAVQHALARLRTLGALRVDGPARHQRLSLTDIGRAALACGRSAAN